MATTNFDQNLLINQYEGKTIFSVDDAMENDIANLERRTAMEDYLLNHNIKYRFVHEYTASGAKHTYFMVDRLKLIDPRSLYDHLSVNYDSELTAETSKGIIYMYHTSSGLLEKIGTMKLSKSVSKSIKMTEALYDPLNDVYINFKEPS